MYTQYLSFYFQSMRLALYLHDNADLIAKLNIKLRYEHVDES